MPVLRVDNVGAAGFRPDVEYWQLDANAWTFLRDVRLGENSIRPPYETAPLFQYLEQELNEIILGVFSHNSIGAWWQIFCTQRRVFVTRGGELIDITPTGYTFSANLEDRWQATSFNGYLLLNNGIDEPHYWPIESVDEATPRLVRLSEYPGSSPWPLGQSCKSLEAFNSSLFAMNISNSNGRFPFLVMFSDFAEPGTLPQAWEPRPDNSAGRRDLADGQDEIVGGKAFKDLLLIRKRTSVYLFRYIGGQFVYQRQVISEETSCMNKFCIANTDSFQVAVGRNDIYITEGGAHRSVVKNKAKNWFFKNMNEEALTASFVLFDSTSNEVWFLTSHGESRFCNVALIWNYLEDTFTTKTCQDYIAGTMGEGILEEGFVSWEDAEGGWE